MKTFMLDSMIFDKIANNEELKKKILELKNHKQIKILTTHVQIDQLKGTPDAARSEKLLKCADEICETIPTRGVVFGVSKWDGARWGDAKDNEAFEKIRQGNPVHAPDALIVTTVQSDADILVTEDRTLASRFQRTNPSPKEVWNYKQFQEYIELL